MSDHDERVQKFERQHIIDTITKMAASLRSTADSLDRAATDERYSDADRANTAWGEIRNMNSNLRVDILISSLGRLVELSAPPTDTH